MNTIHVVCQHKTPLSASCALFNLVSPSNVHRVSAKICSPSLSCCLLWMSFVLECHGVIKAPPLMVKWASNLNDSAADHLKIRPLIREHLCWPPFTLELCMCVLAHQTQWLLKGCPVQLRISPLMCENIIFTNQRLLSWGYNAWSVSFLWVHMCIGEFSYTHEIQFDALTALWGVAGHAGPTVALNVGVNTGTLWMGVQSYTGPSIHPMFCGGCISEYTT